VSEGAKLRLGRGGGVRNVNATTEAAPMLTFGTYVVRFVNTTLRRPLVLTNAPLAG
jgi:hypothetical protein